MARHRDASGQKELKRNNTKISTLRKTYPGLGEGEIRSDATLGTLKEKLGLAQSVGINKVREELRSRKK